MAVKLRAVATALLMGSATVSAMIGAPMAAGSGADATIANLQAQGYLVNINWVNGFDTKPLSECTVTGVNNPSSAPKPGDTVYVDVVCPNHDDDGGVGIGVGIG